MESRVSPNVAGEIRAHTKNYGKRSALSTFILETLKCAKDGIGMHAIAEVALSHLGLEFATQAEFTQFLNNNVKPRVRDLKKNGLVDVSYPFKNKTSGLSAGKTLCQQ